MGRRCCDRFGGLQPELVLVMSRHIGNCCDGLTQETIFRMPIHIPSMVVPFLGLLGWSRWLRKLSRLQLRRRHLQPWLRLARSANSAARPWPSARTGLSLQFVHTLGRSTNPISERSMFMLRPRYQHRRPRKMVCRRRYQSVNAHRTPHQTQFPDQARVWVLGQRETTVVRYQGKRRWLL
jgi:hypothetical protein